MNSDRSCARNFDVVWTLLCAGVLLLPTWQRPSKDCRLQDREVDKYDLSIELRQYQGRLLGALWPRATPFSSLGSSPIDRRRAVVVVSPSFEPEWALALSRKKRGRTELELRSLEKHAWFENFVKDGPEDRRGWAEQPVEIAVDVKSFKVSREFAETMQSLADRALVLQVEPKEGAIVDGTTFRFYAPAGTCRAWRSPREPHPIAPLRVWLEDLRTLLIENNSFEARRQDEMIRRGEEILRRLSRGDPKEAG